MLNLSTMEKYQKTVFADSKASSNPIGILFHRLQILGIRKLV